MRRLLQPDILQQGLFVEPDNHCHCSCLLAIFLCQSLPNTQFTDSLYYTSVVLHSVLPSFCLSLHLMFLASVITTAGSCYQQYPAVLTTLLPLAMISTNSTTLYCCDKQQNRSLLFLLFVEIIFVCWNFKKNFVGCQQRYY